MPRSTTSNSQRSKRPLHRSSTVIVAIIFVLVLLLPRLAGVDSYFITNLGMGFSTAMLALIAARSPADTTSEDPRSSWGLSVALRCFAISAAFTAANGIGRLLVSWISNDPVKIFSLIDPLPNLGSSWLSGSYVSTEYIQQSMMINWTGLLCVWVVYLAAAAIGAAIGSMLQWIPNSGVRIALGLAGTILVVFFGPALYDPVFTTPFRPVPYVLIAFSLIFALAITLALGVLPIRSRVSDPLPPRKQDEGPAPQS